MIEVRFGTTTDATFTPLDAGLTGAFTVGAGLASPLAGRFPDASTWGLASFFGAAGAFGSGAGLATALGAGLLEAFGGTPLAAVFSGFAAGLAEGAGFFKIGFVSIFFAAGLLVFPFTSAFLTAGLSLSLTRSFTFFFAVDAGLAAFFAVASGALAFRLFALDATAFCAFGAGFAGFDFAIVLCSGNSGSVICEKRGKGTTCSAPFVQGESLGMRLCRFH
jgi:hypothetical protein